MASVYRNPGRDVWMMVYRARDGQRVRESSGTTNKYEAQRKAERLETKVDDGIPAKANRITFDDAAADVVNDMRINGRRSIDSTERRIDLHLRPYFGGATKLVTISSDTIRAFVTARLARRCRACDWFAQDRAEDLLERCPACQTATRKGAAAAEVNRELAALKRIFRLATLSGRLTHRPHFAMLAEHNTRTGFFERPMFDAVCEHLAPELRPVVEFAYLTGWRKSEILTLQWRNVDRATGIIRLDPDTTKNEAGRVFPFDVLPALRTLIETQWKGRVDLCPFVFHRSGRAIKSFRQAWYDAGEAAGYPGMLLHDFRRTAVRNLVRAGVPTKTAMMLTGHKTMSVFQRYQIVDEADLRAAVTRYAEGLVSTPGTPETGTPARVHVWKSSTPRSTPQPKKPAQPRVVGGRKSRNS